MGRPAESRSSATGDRRSPAGSASLIMASVGHRPDHFVHAGETPGFPILRGEREALGRGGDLLRRTVIRTDELNVHASFAEGASEREDGPHVRAVATG